jgi:hypothetical protein
VCAAAGALRSASQGEEQYNRGVCCFSPVRAPFGWVGRLFGEGRIHVSDTSIFARMVGPETQLLVYSMKLSVRSEVAMILPVPTLPGAPEDALTFVDLSAHPRLFDELAELFTFPAVQTAAPKSAALRLPSLPVRRLKLHDVGSFVASFVPGRADFHRLEPRFRLPDSVWDALPDARDFGFAVFQLKAGKHQIHPMAMRFRTRDPQRLFFPTVHVHDGEVHEYAKFDHSLYYQNPRFTEAPRSQFLPAVVDDAQVAIMRPRSDYSGMLVDGPLLLRRTIQGRKPNRDTYVNLNGT